MPFPLTRTFEFAGRIGMAPCKVRIRFRKGGDLRLVSHHDLMRCFERMLRRASLPFCSSQGFHPTPRLVFTLSLALGIVGCDETADLQLSEDIAPEEVQERLARQAPAGLEILSVSRVAGGSGSQVRQACYRLPTETARFAELPERVAALLAAAECWVPRERPTKRQVNIRPYVHELRVQPHALEMDLWVTPQGTARPEEIVNLLGLASVLEDGAVLERTRLELHEETPQLESVEGNA
jgi:radical SAM-linked protein